MNNIPQDFQKQMMFPVGRPNDQYAKWFIGNSYLAPLGELSGVGAANVTFEPGCRNNWHIHHASEGGGQMLLCIGGYGWYQEWEKEPQLLSPGSVVCIPPNVKHWHGATHESWFAHISIGVPGKDTSTEWLEPVEPQEYDKLPY